MRLIPETQLRLLSSGTIFGEVQTRALLLGEFIHAFMALDRPSIEKANAFAPSHSRLYKEVSDKLILAIDRLDTGPDGLGHLCLETL
jgi:hypothetical protein